MPGLRGERIPRGMMGLLLQLALKLENYSNSPLFKEREKKQPIDYLRHLACSTQTTKNTEHNKKRL
jgi:hypothetical protein